MDGTDERWTAKAILAWRPGGDSPHEVEWSFDVTCEEAPDLNYSLSRERIALSLACHESGRFAVPPRSVRAWIEGPDGVAGSEVSARWHGTGGFVFGSGIVRVFGPLPGTMLTNLQERDVA